MVSVNTDLYLPQIYKTVFLQCWISFTSFLKLHVQHILPLYTQHLKIENQAGTVK